MQPFSAGAVTHLLFKSPKPLDSFPDSKCLKWILGNTLFWEDATEPQSLRSPEGADIRQTPCSPEHNPSSPMQCWSCHITSETLKHVRNGAIRSFFCGVLTHIPRHGGLLVISSQSLSLENKTKKDIWFRSGESFVKPKGTVIRQSHKMYPVHEAMCSETQIKWSNGTFLLLDFSCSNG